jgi:hypothetical protein
VHGWIGAAVIFEALRCGHDVPSFRG